MFHQMMFAISIFDSVSSFAFLLGSLPVPKSRAMYGARGNETTCKLQGEACRCSVDLPILANLSALLPF
jgi:hypothetical protein